MIKNHVINNTEKSKYEFLIYKQRKKGENNMLITSEDKKTWINLSKVASIDIEGSNIKIHFHKSDTKEFKDCKVTTYGDKFNYLMEEINS